MRFKPRLHCSSSNWHSTLSVGQRQHKPRPTVAQLSWIQGYFSKFQFEAHRGAIESRLKDLLEFAPTMDVAGMRDTHMDPEMRAISEQLFKNADQGVPGGCAEAAGTRVRHRGRSRMATTLGRVRAEDRSEVCTSQYLSTRQAG